MKRGDHLVTERTGYTHHGLYLGNNRVIHYSGLSDSLNKGKIEITSYEKFSQKKHTYVRNCWLRTYNEDESIERAYSRLDEDEYNIIFNNCEHFVTWCIQGISKSEQVDRMKLLYDMAEKQWKEKSKDSSFRRMVKGIIDEEIIRNTVTSSISKTTLNNAVGTTAGIVTASAITGGTAIGVTSAIAAGSIATVAAPLAIAAGVGYGVTKVVDWLWD